MSQSHMYEDEERTALGSEDQDSAMPEETAGEEETIVYSEQKTVNRSLVRLRRFLVSFGVFLFMIACLITTYQLREEARELDKTIEKLENEIAEEKAKTLEYRVEQSYYKSEQYKEEMARNRFRLIFPGETLIQVN